MPAGARPAVKGALLGPPERGLAPARHPQHGHDLEGRLGQRIGDPHVPHTQAAGDRHAVAVVPIQQLQHRSHLPEALRPLEGLGNVDRVHQPDAPVVGQRVRRALERLVHDPGEAEREDVQRPQAHPVDPTRPSRAELPAATDGPRLVFRS